jgi:5'-nucleotidase, C-terminal domain
MREQYHADVALLQERDFYVQGLQDYLAEHCTHLDEHPLKCSSHSISQLDLQEILDRIIWKGDYIQVKSVQGKVLTNVLKESDQFAKSEKTAYLAVNEVGRPLVKLGFRKDVANGGDYLINGKPLDPNALYTVVTSDHVALGDTGYADLATPPVGSAPVAGSSSEEIVTVSGSTCEILADFTTTPPAFGCAVTLNRKNYYDRLARRLDDTRKGNTSWHKLYAWTFFHGDLGQPAPKRLRDTPVGPEDIGAETQKRIESLENWDFSLDKLSLGLSALTHTGTEQTLSQEFGGVQNAQVNAKHSHSWDWDVNSKLTWFHPRLDLFASEALQYSSSFQSQLSGPRSETQSRNLFALDGGTYLHPWRPFNRKDLPQFSLVLSGHFETQVGNPITNISLSAIPPSISSSTLSFKQGRTKLLLDRTGLRFQDRKSYVEGGIEAGQTLNAIQRFDVLTGPGGITFPCLLQATISLTKCINNFNKANPATPVAPSSSVVAVRSPQNRYGAYWMMGVSVPLHPSISYIFQDTSDYFFLSHGDNSADTRFRHQVTNTLKFMVFPNLSFEPTYTIFFYENKVDYHFLLQQQYIVKINYSFDWSNLHESDRQLKYKKPSAQ